LSAQDSGLNNIPTYKVKASQSWSHLDLKELWERRELLFFLAWRDIKVRYKQTVIGAGWAIIQPVATMLVFSVFFGGMLKISSNGIPYPVFSYAALVPWTFFANSVGQASNSLVSNGFLLRKVYFPRLILPIADILAGGVDFILAFVVLLVMMMFFGLVPRVEALVVIPALLFILVITALGISLWLSGFNVRYRDIQYIVPFLIQIWMYATPIVYSSNVLTGPLRVLYSLNPMTPVVEGFRWALVGGADLSLSMFLTAGITALILLISGLIYFQRAEGTFADVL